VLAAYKLAWRQWSRTHTLMQRFAAGTLRFEQRCCTNSTGTGAPTASPGGFPMYLAQRMVPVPVALALCLSCSGSDPDERDNLGSSGTNGASSAMGTMGTTGTAGLTAGGTNGRATTGPGTNAAVTG